MKEQYLTFQNNLLTTRMGEALLEAFPVHARLLSYVIWCATLGCGRLTRGTLHDVGAVLQQWLDLKAALHGLQAGCRARGVSADGSLEPLVEQAMKLVTDLEQEVIWRTLGDGQELGRKSALKCCRDACHNLMLTCSVFHLPWAKARDLLCETLQYAFSGVACEQVASLWQEVVTQSTRVGDQLKQAPMELQPVAN